MAGRSGYLGSLETEQVLYLEKLKAASDRMRLAQGTDGAVHYVTVELMRQYVGCSGESLSDAVGDGSSSMGCRV